MTNLDRTLEAHNRIFQFICMHSNQFCHVPHWHGEFVQNDISYNNWMDDIIKKLNKEYIISKYPKYYNMLCGLDEDNQYNIDKYDQDAIEIYRIIKNLYPILKNEIRGNYFPYQCAIMENIINPLLLDQDFYDINVSDYML